MKPGNGGRADSGFTLTELLFVLGVLAVLTSLALPSLADQRDRQRLQSAAEALAADLAEARFDAVQRGRSLHLSLVTGTDWCWALAPTPGCDCRSKPACTVKAVRGSELPGVRLAEGSSAVFEPTGIAPATTVASFESARGERLQVVLSPLGRARICAPGGAVLRYPVC
jgi:type IV fimbrial biogenesis protein FimT